MGHGGPVRTFHHFHRAGQHNHKAVHLRLAVANEPYVCTVMICIVARPEAALLAYGLHAQDFLARDRDSARVAQPIRQHVVQGGEFAREPPPEVDILAADLHHGERIEKGLIELNHVEAMRWRSS
jgi:hypothetical protein